jgi:hypothetical protein
MPDDISVIKVYDDEMEASMAQQVLENAGIKVTLLKDDGGGLMPSLQMTEGVTLVVNKDDEARAMELVQDFEGQKSEIVNNE